MIGKNNFQFSTLHFQLKKSGFTLAEVLITLGIIGVVSAITIPTLIQNYQKHVTVIRLKKAYSQISQAIQMASKDYGTMDGWIIEEGDTNSFDGAKYFTENFIFPNLKTIKKCVPTSNECWSDNYTNLTGEPVTTYNSGRKVSFIDASGNSYLFWTNGNGKGGWLWIDINGKSKPNQIGKDIFAFEVQYGRTQNNGFYSGGILFSKNREDLLNGSNGISSYACNKNSGSGQFCSAVIELDGWKIEKDYPW